MTNQTSDDEGLTPIERVRLALRVNDLDPVIDSGDVHVLLNAYDALQEPVTARLRSEWHEDMGPVLWWRFPVNEPPYVGTPFDLPRDVMVPISPILELTLQGLGGGGWPGYHTHWTPLPSIPIQP